MTQSRFPIAKLERRILSIEVPELPRRLFPFRPIRGSFPKNFAVFIVFRSGERASISPSTARTLIRITDPEFVELAIERRQPHSQPAGCLALVVPTFAQDPLYVVGLVFADCLTQIIASGVGVRREEETRRKIVGREYLVLRSGSSRRSQRIIELTHIADPGSRHQSTNGRAVDANDSLAQAFGVLREQDRHELGNIFATIAQRRQMDGYDVQAIKEIGAKPVSGDLSREVFVGRGEQPGFETKLAVSPLPATLPCFRSLAGVWLESTGPARRFRQEKRCPVRPRRKSLPGRDPHPVKAPRTWPKS